jgi:hypothetical protein
MIHERGKNKFKDETTAKKKVLVSDKLNPEILKIVEIPLTEEVITLTFPDETLESLGNKISNPIETTKIMEIKGDEAQKDYRTARKRAKRKIRMKVNLKK